jgi:hypothetical protein
MTATRHQEHSLVDQLACQNLSSHIHRDFILQTASRGSVVDSAGNETHPPGIRHNYTSFGLQTSVSRENKALTASRYEGRNA